MFFKNSNFKYIFLYCTIYILVFFTLLQFRFFIFFLICVHISLEIEGSDVVRGEKIDIMM